MERVPAVEHAEVCVALHALAHSALKLADVAAAVCHCEVEVYYTVVCLALLAIAAPSCSPQQAQHSVLLHRCGELPDARLPVAE